MKWNEINVIGMNFPGGGGGGGNQYVVPMRITKKLWKGPYFLSMAALKSLKKRYVFSLTFNTFEEKGYFLCLSLCHLGVEIGTTDYGS